MLSKPKKQRRFLILLLSAVVISVLLNFLGAPIIRVLRNAYSKKAFWISGFIASSVLLALDPGLVLISYLLLSMWITIGLYQEFEEKGHSNLRSALIATFAGTVVMICGPLIWSHFFDLQVGETIKASFNEMGKQLLGGKDLAEFGIKTDRLLGVMPAAVAVIQFSCLAFALMLDRRMAAVFGVRFENIASRMRLIDFRCPDSFIWVTMASFLLSFIGGIPEVISLIGINVFILMMGLYFFQGLAVVEFTFIVMRVSSLVKLLIYLLIIAQLFFLLSFVGVIDFWADFRLKLKRWKMAKKNENDGENV